ncbi:MAG TPA: ankyrin repeat domain-containing protein [Anaerolineae bacterium]
MTDNGHGLIDAVKAGDADAVKALLASDPALVNAKDESGNSAILLATYYERKPIVDLLLAYKPTLSLFEASAVGDLERVKSILAEDPDLIAELMNAYSHDGFTPLGLAAFFGHADIAEYLLARGAEVNSVSRNRMRVMPLHSAVAGRHLRIAEALIAHGADVNAAQQDGFTPLHGAAQNGQQEMVLLLLDHGAEVKAKAGDGRTALAFALAEGHASVADSLRRRGAEE